MDTLTARESAAAALAFARKHLGNKPVTAIVFTHSHADHFGGALGVATAQGNCRAQDSGDRVRGLHRGSHQREHPGRHRDGKTLDVPVRQEPDAWPQGHRRYRPGQEHGLWRRRRPGADPAHHQTDAGADAGRRALSSTTCRVPKPRRK
ncbi:MBL fold metallo-hydrolase [Candidatus Skiveiella danica]|uniref:MBL fold metallo-hydrolase n=1 Tax=Candidatus Skiveiella danica TaxID=3386177 RepID=UPI0039B9CD83